LKKLVHFFEKSRDNWKERAKKAEDELKEINSISVDDIKKNS